jgi:hypothetical protein
MIKWGTMKRTESRFVSRAAMLGHMAEGWRLADPPQVKEGGGERLFLVVRDKPAPALWRGLCAVARAVRAVVCKGGPDASGGAGA